MQIEHVYNKLQNKTSMTGRINYKNNFWNFFERVYPPRVVNQRKALKLRDLNEAPQKYIKHGEILILSIDNENIIIFS